MVMIGFFFKAYIDTLDLFLKWNALEKVLFIYCQVVLFENDDNYIVL